MRQKLDSMNWELRLRTFFLLVVAAVLLSCHKDDVVEPAWLDQLSVREELGDVEVFLREKLESNDELDRVFAGLKLAYAKVKEDTQYGEGLMLLSAIEKDVEVLQSDSLTAEVNYLKAQIYRSLGLDKKRVLEYSRAAIDKATSGRKYVFLGNHTTYLLDAGEFEEAIRLQQELQKVYLGNGNNVSEAQAVEAFAYFELAQELERKTISNELELNEVLSDSLRIQSMYDRATRLMKASLSTLEGVTNVIDKEHVYSKAIALGVLSDQEQYECLEFAKEHGLYKLEIALRESRQDFSAIGESQEESLKRYNEVLKEGLKNEQKLKNQIANYEAGKARINDELAQERASLQQGSYLTALFGALLILLISIIFFRAQSLANSAKLEQQDSSILLANYKNRIRPHFLFNQLNNVNGFISQEKWDDAQEYIGLLSVHLRSILENSEEDNTIVRLEFDRIHNYVALQQKSSFAHVDFRAELDSKSSRIKIPSGLLQPLIENSYKYAGNASEKNSWIRLTAKTVGEELRITVEDSGYGFLERIPGTGIGLSLVRERIEFNKSKSRNPKLWGIETNFGKRKSTVKLTMPSKLV